MITNNWSSGESCLAKSLYSNGVSTCFIVVVSGVGVGGDIRGVGSLVRWFFGSLGRGFEGINGSVDVDVDFGSMVRCRQLMDGLFSVSHVMPKMASYWRRGRTLKSTWKDCPWRFNGARGNRRVDRCMDPSASSTVLIGFWGSVVNPWEFTKAVLTKSVDDPLSMRIWADRPASMPSIVSICLVVLWWRT